MDWYNNVRSILKQRHYAIFQKLVLLDDDSIGISCMRLDQSAAKAFLDSISER